MKEEPIILAESLGWKVYKNADNKYIIEVPIKNKKVLLKEESNKWLLISNQKAQIILKTKEASEFMKEVKKKRLWIDSKIFIKQFYYIINTGVSNKIKFY